MESLILSSWPVVKINDFLITSPFAILRLLLFARLRLPFAFFFSFFPFHITDLPNRTELNVVQGICVIKNGKLIASRNFEASPGFRNWTFQEIKRFRCGTQNVAKCILLCVSNLAVDATAKGWEDAKDFGSAHSSSFPITRSTLIAFILFLLIDEFNLLFINSLLFYYWNKYNFFFINWNCEAKINRQFSP